MSKIEKIICDECGKEVKDHYSLKGWIRFDGGTIAVTDGRAAGTSGNAITRFYHSSSNSQPLDLCSTKCLLKKFKLEEKHAR